MLWRRYLASCHFAFSSALQNFWRNLAVSLTAVFTMTLILIMVGINLLGSHLLNNVIDQEQSKASSIKIFLVDNISLATITNLQTQLSKDPRVLSVSFENKDEALKEAQSRPDIQQNLNLSLLGGNPFPASLNLQLRDLKDVGAIDAQVKGNPLVEQGKFGTNYDPNIINKLQNIISTMRLIAIVLGLALAAISIVIIMNTIKTAVYLRREEIEVMKLVGATNWFVRWPFILEGMFMGFIASIISGLLITIFYQPIVNNLKSTLFFFPLEYDANFVKLLLFLLVLAGMGLGALGSFMGLRKFLKV